MHDCIHNLLTEITESSFAIPYIYYRTCYQIIVQPCYKMSKSDQSNYGKNSKDSMLRISCHTKHENMSNVDYHLIPHLKETTQGLLVLVTCAVHKETYVCFFFQLEKHFMTGVDYETDYWLL